MKNNEMCCNCNIKQACNIAYPFVTPCGGGSKDIQDLKTKITPLLTDALDEFADGKFSRGKFFLDRAIEKLSAG